MKASGQRLRRLFPWGVAAVAAAAVLITVATRAQPDRAEEATSSSSSTDPSINFLFRSRPSDPLIGMIAPSDGERASERLDTLFSDRMDGYRELRFRLQLYGAERK
jgi:hypothetical protein